MLKLLFIDDKPDSFESLKNFLRQQRLNFEGETHNFPKARNRVAGYRSDIVILDLADAASLENLEAEAKDTLDLFWKEHFCPIIVYAADPDLLTEVPSLAMREAG